MRGAQQEASPTTDIALKAPNVSVGCTTSAIIHLSRPIIIDTFDCLKFVVSSTFLDLVMREPTEARKVLIVDDNADFAAFVGEVARGCGLSEHILIDTTQFKEHCEQLRPEIVVLDITMPGVGGLMLAQWLGEYARRHQPDLRLVILSGRDEETIQHCREVGANSGVTDIIALAKPVAYLVLAEALTLGAS